MRYGKMRRNTIVEAEVNARGDGQDKIIYSPAVQANSKILARPTCETPPCETSKGSLRDLKNSSNRGPSIATVPIPCTERL